MATKNDEQNSIGAGQSLERGKRYLDEATENLTFAEFGWAFEEAWRGVAWMLNALLDSPRRDLQLGRKGNLPRSGSLRRLLHQLSKPPGQVEIVEEFESTRTRISRSDELVAEEVERLVFAAWELHDECGSRLALVDERLGDRLILTDVSPGRVGSRIIERRTALKLLMAGSVLPLHACKKVDADNTPAAARPTVKSAGQARKAAIKAVTDIRGMNWPTSDPFLFCAYHVDDYPHGNAELGPVASLEGRHLGRDFDERNAWRMYHGKTVPGFPRHPHRGFETVTFVRSGMLDHSDSMGATARYGGGDVQWLTSGAGIQHAEMFPLVRPDSPNPLELFQIWMNLARRDKMVDPHFKMLWSEDIPRVSTQDSHGRATEITVAAGAYKSHRPPAPPPDSWASKDDSDVAIWSIRMEPGAEFKLPAVDDGTHRSLYVHQGGGVEVAGRSISEMQRVEFVEPGTVELHNLGEESQILLLQGKPIDEPVAKRGPFVMNTQDEIRQAYTDFQRTQFGGWPWDGNGPVHDGDRKRFARHIDGRYEEPT